MTVAVTKERPLLFSGAMVRALLEGTKTQTRRLVKPQPRADVDDHLYHGRGMWRFYRKAFGGARSVDHPTAEDGGYRCPYGQPGERLWVRETWAKVPATAYQGSIDTATDGTRTVVPHRELNHGLYWSIYRADWTRVAPERWRPSIHMPRAACRIVLEITDVRVQRLQEITEDDARAEGIDLSGINLDVPATFDRPMAYEYRRLWDSINGAGAWSANPWVWCVSFKRVTP